MKKFSALFLMVCGFSVFTLSSTTLIKHQCIGQKFTATCFIGPGNRYFFTEKGAHVLCKGNYTNEQTDPSPFVKTKKDTTVYWVNSSYLACLDSGKSIHQCGEVHKFLMVDLDTVRNKLTIEPAINFSWEELEGDIKREEKKQGEFSLLPGLEFQTGGRVLLKNSTLTLMCEYGEFEFERMKFESFEKYPDFEMGTQIAILNCKSLLNYSFDSCTSGSQLLFSKSEFRKWTLNGQARCYCSDDYGYDEMNVREEFDSISTGFALDHYFLEYRDNGVKIYKTPPRNRFERVDISKLTECQQLSKRE